ncbi:MULTISPECIES: YheC/YheD family protein [Bacillus]|nr:MULTISPECIES: YheC/YheD family protein [Bacillus]MBP1083688.1 hypothetical protein [Bacillus capparidis]MED1094876.1 YheC/YheD family protein [Bacillus capparidis]
MINKCLGVLSGKPKKGNTFKGDSKFFKHLQMHANSRGILCYVFTLNGIFDSYLKGFYFDFHAHKWLTKEVSFPNLVYNRLPRREEEVCPSWRLFFAKKNIPIFNRQFFNKSVVHKLLEDHPVLRGFLPNTKIGFSSDGLFSMLETHSSIYIKDSNGSKGNGIFFIVKKDGGYLLKTPHEEFKHLTFDRLLDQLYFFSVARDSLIQEAVDCDERNGYRFDLRVLANYAGKRHSITGIGVRAANSGQIVTHVPNGGFVIPYDSISSDINNSELEAIVSHTGDLLSRTYGFIGEFSMDIGFRHSRPIIFEANSKPMIFDENEIQLKRVEKLINLLDENQVRSDY